MTTTPLTSLPTAFTTAGLSPGESAFSAENERPRDVMMVDRLCLNYYYRQTRHQLYSGLGADIVMESISPH